MTPHRNGHGTAPTPDARGVSGRRFVVLAVLGLLIGWGTLYAAFVGWRSRYRERAEYGRTAVATAIDPMGDLPPPSGADPAAWRSAVDQTRAMIAEVTAAGLLDRPALESLRDELAAAVARARTDPATARDELAAIWDRMERRTKLRRQTTRPSLLGPPAAAVGAQ